MITEQRIQTQEILQGTMPGLVAIAGPCANHDSQRILVEGMLLSNLASDSLVTLHRQPFWKPRSPALNGPKPWEGLEDTDPEIALSRAQLAVDEGVSIAAEIGKTEHINRYSDLLTFAWIGARSLDNMELIDYVASNLPADLPLGIKNDLTGNIDGALKTIDRINERRADMSDHPAEAILIFRGGSDFDKPRKWSWQVEKAYVATAGRLIIDTAHGSEMAHDPEGNFKKSVEGQIFCLEHVIFLADHGIFPRGVMIEASDYENPDKTKRTDPNMPFASAAMGILELSRVIDSKVGVRT